MCQFTSLLTEQMIDFLSFLGNALMSWLLRELSEVIAD